MSLRRLPVANNTSLGTTLLALTTTAALGGGGSSTAAANDENATLGALDLYQPTNRSKSIRTTRKLYWYMQSFMFCNQIIAENDQREIPSSSQAYLLGGHSSRTASVALNHG